MTTFAEVGEGHQTYEPTDQSTPLRTSTGGGGQAANIALFQANGAATERGGFPTLASSDDNGTNQIVVGTLPSTGAAQGYRCGPDEAAAGHVVAHSLRPAGCDASEDGTGRGTPLVAFHLTQDPISGEVAPAQGGGNASGCATAGVAYTVHGTPATNVASEDEVASSLRARTPGTLENSTTEVIAVRTQQTGANGLNVSEGVSPTLGAGDQPPAGLPAAGMTVRRLTPTECLRLQGLPDDHLDLDPPLSDSRKYHMIGNSGALPVVEWIARRIRAAEEVTP